MEYVVEDQTQLKEFVDCLKTVKLPFTATVVAGRHRSLAQNRLQRKWIKEISAQWYMDPEDVRAYCKLRFGVPILRNENEFFCEKYDSVLKDLTYERKIAIMRQPLDLPVTRIMTTKQKKNYLDALYEFFVEKGFHLTEPEDHAS